MVSFCEAFEETNVEKACGISAMKSEANALCSP